MHRKNLFFGIQYNIYFKNEKKCNFVENIIMEVLKLQNRSANEIIRYLFDTIKANPIRK